MSGWLYLIKNGGLYKIGITRNFDKRMRQLKPDKVIVKYYSIQFRELEKELHKRFSKKRLPQSEYFRLSDKEIKQFKKKIDSYICPNYILFITQIFLFLNLIFLLLLLLFLLLFNDSNLVLFNTLLWLERLSYALSIKNLIIKSNYNYNFSIEFKSRLFKFATYIFFGFIIGFAKNLFT